MMERKVSGNSISSLIGERLPFCSGCNELIKEQYLLEAVEKFWHENCLKCSLCKGPLAEMSTTFYAKADLLLCKRDYFRLFGRTGICSACHKDIPSFEYVMRARGNSYHLDCFACQSCNQRFCVGDRFYLYEERILCEEDYKDVISARGNNNSNNGNNVNHHHHHGLDHHHHHHHHTVNNVNHHHHLNNNQVIPTNTSNSTNNTNSSNKKSDQPTGHHPVNHHPPNHHQPPPQSTRLYSCHDH
ncbi:LIM domain only protein 3-like [Panonychus citri]|uniref:LIM domain only protein 3-like n=1 Tax=Panonychus citri TaxID=50023 RepID=UPI0023076475|nr:LIM domain only protein 3-like [Panonychus citri]